MERTVAAPNNEGRLSESAKLLRWTFEGIRRGDCGLMLKEFGRSCFDYTKLEELQETLGTSTALRVRLRMPGDGFCNRLAAVDLKIFYLYLSLLNCFSRS